MLEDIFLHVPEMVALILLTVLSAKNRSQLQLSGFPSRRLQRN